MKNWKTASLAELGTVTTGSTPQTSQAHYYGGDIPFVTPAELDQAETITSTPRTLSTEGAKVARLLPPGAVLVCCIGSLGKVGMVGRSVATNQQINSIVFDETLVWPRYGFYACKLLKPKLEGMAPATTVAIVNKSKFEALEIPVPPLHEQKRIASILDQADELRRLRQRAIDRLNDLEQAIFYEMFGDPAINPMGWPIGSIDELTNSTQYGTSEKAGSQGLFPILRMGNLTSSGQLDFSDLKYINLETKDIEKYTVRDEDILFNRTNSPDLVGKTAVFYGAETYAFAGYLVRLRVNERAVPEYINSFLNSAFGKKILRGMCKTIIGMANINARELRGIAIPHPPIALQRTFQKRLQTLRQFSPQMMNSAFATDRLFAGLQNRAFRGEL